MNESANGGVLVAEEIETINQANMLTSGADAADVGIVEPEFDTAPIQTPRNVKLAMLAARCAGGTRGCQSANVTRWRQTKENRSIGEGEPEWQGRAPALARRQPCNDEAVKETQQDTASGQEHVLLRYDPPPRLEQPR